MRPTALAFPVLLLAPACADWPRFAAESEQIPLFGPQLLVEDVDWPNDPADLEGDADGELLHVLDWMRISGTLDPFGTFAQGSAPAFQDSCPGVTNGVFGSYDGDVDVIRLRHPGRGICLYFGVPDQIVESETPPQWDVVVYEFQSGCATGPFLSHASVDGAVELQPKPVIDGSTTHVEAAAREILVYVAGVNGFPRIPVDYTLDLLSTDHPDRCPALPDDSGES